MRSEVYAFLYMLPAGALAALIYDFFRAVHLTARRHTVITAVTDIIYWFLAAVILIYGTMVSNNGLLRGYVLLGIFLGAVLYFLTLSRPVYFIFSVFVTALSKIIGYIFKFILTGAAFLYKIVLIPIKYICRGTAGKTVKRSGGVNGKHADGKN